MKPLLQLRNFNAYDDEAASTFLESAEPTSAQPPPPLLALDALLDADDVLLLVVPEVPLVPLLPEVPLVPDVPLVPLVPLVPEVPLVPLAPEVPLVPEVPEVPLVPDVPLVPLDVPELPPLPVEDDDEVEDPTGGLSSVLLHAP